MLAVLEGRLVYFLVFWISAVKLAFYFILSSAGSGYIWRSANDKNRYKISSDASIFLEGLDITDEIKGDSKGLTPFKLTLATMTELFLQHYRIVAFKQNCIAWKCIINFQVCHCIGKQVSVKIVFFS